MFNRLVVNQCYEEVRKDEEGKDEDEGEKGKGG